MQQNLKETLLPLLRVLKQLGGTLVFSDDEGEQYVIARRSDLEKNPSRETQLSFHDAAAVSRAIKKNLPSDVNDEVLERINRDIALSQVQEEVDLGNLREHGGEIPKRRSAFNAPKPPPLRVKFEPIKGDLPPELQE